MYGLKITTSDGSNSPLGVRLFREIAYHERILTGGQAWYQQELSMTLKTSRGLEGGSYILIATAHSLTTNVTNPHAVVMVNGDVPTTIVIYQTPFPSSVSVLTNGFKQNSAQGRIGVSLFILEV